MNTAADTNLYAVFTSPQQTVRTKPAGPFPDTDSLLQAFSYEKLMVPGITFVIILTTILKQLKKSGVFLE